MSPIWASDPSQKYFRICFQICWDIWIPSLTGRHICIIEATRTKILSKGGEFWNMDIIGLGKYSSPMGGFMFDCSFKGKESLSKCLLLTCSYSKCLATTICSGKIWLSATRDEFWPTTILSSRQRQLTATWRADQFFGIFLLMTFHRIFNFNANFWLTAVMQCGTHRPAAILKRQ